MQEKCNIEFRIVAWHSKLRLCYVRSRQEYKDAKRGNFAEQQAKCRIGRGCAFSRSQETGSGRNHENFRATREHFFNTTDRWLTAESLVGVLVALIALGILEPFDELLSALADLAAGLQVDVLLAGLGTPSLEGLLRDEVILIDLE